MLILLCALLALACLWLLCRQLLLKKQLRDMAAQVEAIAREHSNRQLRVETGDADALAMANAVNALFDEVWQERAVHVAALQKTQRSMADISHDLRTPLTSIIGYLRLLQKPDTAPAKREEYLATALGRAESLHRLVNTLFEYARLETGDYPFEMAPVEMNGALADALAGFYEGFTAAGIMPEVALYEGALPVLADGGALERVFQNLLGNCLRHGAGGVKVSTGVEGGRAVARFANAAPGLAGQDIEHLFDRSYVADASRTGQSTGLGLAIVRQFVHQMGGGVSAGLQGGVLTITVQLPLLPGPGR